VPQHGSNDAPQPMTSLAICQRLRDPLPQPLEQLHTSAATLAPPRTATAACDAHARWDGLKAVWAAGEWAAGAAVKGR
jgi:hypothetical protein